METWVARVYMMRPEEVDVSRAFEMVMELTHGRIRRYIQLSLAPLSLPAIPALEWLL